MSTWNSQEMSFKSFKIKDFYFLSILNNIRVGQKRSIITIIYTWKIYPMCLKLPPPAKFSLTWGENQSVPYSRNEVRHHLFSGERYCIPSLKNPCILYTKTLNFKIRWFANENWKKCHSLYLTHLSFFCNLKKRRCSDKTPTAIGFSRCIKPAEGITHIS